MSLYHQNINKKAVLINNIIKFHLDQTKIKLKPNNNIHYLIVNKPFNIMPNVLNLLSNS